MSFILSELHIHEIALDNRIIASERYRLGYNQLRNLGKKVW